METIRWRLKEFLDEHNISAYQLVDRTHGRISRTGVYRLTGEDLKGVRFDSLAALLPALSELTGEEVRVEDLIAYEPPKPQGQKGAWRKLIGALNDPDSPGDISTRHDDYLAEALAKEHDERSLGGQR